MRFVEFLEKWRFGVLLLMVVAALVAEPILFGPRASSWIFDIVYSSILVAAIFAVTRRQRSRVWFVALGLMSLGATWVYHVVPESLLTIALVLHHLVGIAFLLIIVVTTLVGLFSQKEVNLDIVLGSLAGYLLLGTAWALLYSLIHLVSPDSFATSTDLPRYIDDPNSRLSVFLYYSFVTLTTVGFGDMSPVSQTARTFSWLEAAVGQFYIATLVAGLVGIFVSRRANPIENNGDKAVDSAQQSKRIQRE